MYFCLQCTLVAEASAWGVVSMGCVTIISQPQTEAVQQSDHELSGITRHTEPSLHVQRRLEASRKPKAGLRSKSRHLAALNSLHHQDAPGLQQTRLRAEASLASMPALTVANIRAKAVSRSRLAHTGKPHRQSWSTRTQWLTQQKPPADQLGLSGLGRPAEIGFAWTWCAQSRAVLL